MLMNGKDGFFHPVTGVWVAPYTWYEGYAHKEHEQQSADDVAEQETEQETDSTPLESLSHHKLKQLAKAKGIEGWSTKTADELVELLKVADSE